MRKLFTIPLFLLLLVNYLSAQSLTFSYTGAVQTYTVPACVYSIAVDAYGAEGGSSVSSAITVGGQGGRVQATILVTPGEVLNIYVGQKAPGAAGGWNGGGYATTAAGGGGGSSDIRQGGNTLADRVIVAAGGGGAGHYVSNTTFYGGDGGGLNGVAGNPSGTYTGGGGTQTSGGAGGTGAGGNGSPGVLYLGGNGNAADGGGGGGGLYGGGGGAFTGTVHYGGGGGSSYAVSSAYSVTHTSGFRYGDGQVILQPVTGTPAPRDISGPVVVCSGSTATYSFTPVPSATSYTWTVPPGWTVSSGQGTNTADITFGSTSGSFSVSAIGPCGTSAATTVAVTVNLSPNVITTANPSQYCQGGNSQLNATGNAAPTVIVGAGTVVNTTSTYPAPYGQRYTGARHQLLVPAAELSAAGLTAGNITSLDFYVTTPNGTYSNFTISIGNTALSSLTTTFQTGLTQVFTTATFTPVAGWNTHVFQTPFFWDGTSNIIVNTFFLNCPSCPGSGCSSFTNNAIHQQTNTSYNSSLYYYNHFVCNIATITSGTVATRRPNMKFVGATQLFSWSPPTALSSSTIANPVATPSGTTTYSCTITDGFGCTGTSPVTVTVHPIPAAPNLTSNSPVCDGNTIQLFADSVSGGIFTWSGPDGFTSSVQNPTIPNATAAAAGTYSVTVTANGCTSPVATITITINPSPAAPVVSSNSPLCEGSTLNLSATAGSGANYQWTGPNGFSDPAQNPALSNITTSAAGIYSVTVTENGCTSPAGTITITVNPLPATPATGSNSPLCEGTTLNLTASTEPGATYTWTGPNTFSSTDQNPSISGVTANEAGTYSVTVTVNGCTSLAGNATVIVNTVTDPVITASGPTTFCAGDSLELISSGTDHQWSTGATTQSIWVTMSGNYSVTAADANGCAGTSAATSVTVNANPVVTFNGLNSGYCLSNPAGSLTGNPAGGTFTGPGISGNNFDPVTAGAGTHTIMYAFTDANGCSGSTLQTTFVSTNAFVNLGPDTTVCADAPPFILNAGTFSDYTWQDNSTNATFTVDAVALGLGQHTLYVNVTDANGCTGVDSFVVVVDGCLGISEGEIIHVSLSPNPATGILNIIVNNPNNKKLELVVMNIEGQIVVEKCIEKNYAGIQSSFQLDLSNLSAAVYFLKVTDGEKISLHKIVLQ